jgi:nucleotide-binding universal stress UspA family protein
MGAQATSSGLRFENVLYTTDFHGYSKAALPYALSIARKYGSKVYAAHIISLSPFPNTAPTGAWRAIEAQAVREAKEAMIELSSEFAGIPNEGLIRKGDIWKEISTIVKEKRIDLIVAVAQASGRC